MIEMISLMIQILSNIDCFIIADETYVVNQSYTAQNPDEISLDQGSFVIILEKSFTGWWTVK